MKLDQKGNKMKTVTYVVLMAVMVTAALDAPTQAQSQGQSMIKQFREAYKKERGKDLDGAIQGYQEIIANTNANRRHAAEAQYRLGMCYLTTKNKDKGIEEFQRLISNFSQDFPQDYPKDMSPVERAKQQLKSLGVEVAPKKPTEDKKTEESKKSPRLVPENQDRSIPGIPQEFGREYPPQETVKVKILGVTDKSMEKAIIEKLKTMVDSKHHSVKWSRRGDVLNASVASVRNVDNFIKKIDFGTITSIKKRAIVVSLLETELSHDDGLTTNNKYSLADGYAVRFEVPRPGYSLMAVRIKSMRRPHNAKPNERDFHVFVRDENSKVVATFPFPYTQIELLGDPGWVTLKVKPTTVPSRFIIYLVANQSLYLNRDTKGTGNSFKGLPGSKMTPCDHDWMIRAVVKPPKPAFENAAKKSKKRDTAKGHTSKDAKTSKGIAQSTKVQGRISGTDVVLKDASFKNGQLAIYAGDSWGFNPSVLIFLFTEEGTIPEDKLFSATPEAKFAAKTPHVHYRWLSGESGHIKTEIVMHGYRLHLKFGQVADGKIPGEILFEIPDKDTRIEGHFIAEIKD